MNNKIAKLIKDNYLDSLTWKDKISGLVQTVNTVDKVDKTKDVSYPVSCDIDADSCSSGAYQDLCPNSAKKSVIYFEDHGGCDQVEQKGNKITFSCKLRLVAWLNLKKIQEESCDSGVTGCGTSGDYVIDVIKHLPHVPFSTVDFISISIQNISQAQRDVSIFSRYTYAERETQYLMFPYDYFSLDLDIRFTIPCVE